MPQLSRARAVSCTLATLALTSASVGCREIKKALSPPEPVAVVAVVDSSASFEHSFNDAKALLMTVNEHMEPQLDHLHLFRVGAEVAWLYSGARPAPMKLDQQFGSYVRVKEREEGTAYGSALLRGAKEASGIANQHKRVAILVMGDGADEPTKLAKNIEWPEITRQYKVVPPNVALFMAFLQPEEATVLRDHLEPVLKDRFKPFNVEASKDNSAYNELTSYLYQER